MHARARSRSRPLPRTTILTVTASLMAALGTDSALAVSVTCGEVITQDTKLENDLLDCPEHGIVIGADNITLDLGGHMIDGDREGFFDHGIDNTAGYDGVSIGYGKGVRYGGRARRNN